MCRMLIAVGNVNVNLLLDGLVTMANDENEKHERNQNKNGNWKHDGGWGIAYLENNRWIVEKSISEQIDFFHLNRVSSSMVIKVDFDLTMTILAHNLYRLLADKLDRYSHYSDIKIYEQFIMNSGEINIFNDQVHVMLKKKKNLPLVLSIMEEFSSVKYPWLKNRTLEFRGMSNS